MKRRPMLDQVSQGPICVTNELDLRIDALIEEPILGLRKQEIRCLTGRRQRELISRNRDDKVITRPQLVSADKLF